MPEYRKLRIGDMSDNGQITIVDEDRLCYIVRNENHGAVGLRTISKALLSEFVSYVEEHPDANGNEAKNALSGYSDIDKFEYGYNATYVMMAKMVLGFVNVIGNNASSKPPTNYISAKLQQIYYGAPGTGKSHIINEQVCNESVIRTTFHPDSDYSTFVGCYKPTTKTIKMRDLSGHVIKENGVELTEDRIVYEFVEQAFLQAYIQAWKFYDRDNEEVEKQFLVIEEINRGNCAQIFGDLFQLLDRNRWGFSDYPIKADNDMCKQLARAFKGLEISQENKDRINACYKGGKDIVQQVLSGEILLLPDNFNIWATMNTSDQSLFPIDSAFKRRWDWQYMPISKGRENGKDMNWSIVADENEYDWWSFLTKINEQIGSTTNSEDKKLGFFFCKAVNGKISTETFVGKVIFYLWNDVFKDFGFDNVIFNDEDGSTLSFDKFYATDDVTGKIIVKKDKVRKFLENLGVEIASNQELVEEDEIDDFNIDLTTEELVKNSSDRTAYTINGNNVGGKCNVAFEAIKIFAQNHIDYTPEQIVEDWKGLKIKHMPHLVESETTHLERKQKSTDLKFDDKSKRLEVNGRVLYVSNQFNPERILEFETKVNNQNWGIKIDKVE